MDVRLIYTNHTFKYRRMIIKNMKREFKCILPGFEYIKSTSIVLEEDEGFIKMRTPNSFCKNCNKYKDMLFISSDTSTMCYECGYSYYGIPIIKDFHVKL